MSVLSQKPSHLLSYMTVSQSANWTQLKLQPSLTTRQANLLVKQQQARLSPDEHTELEAIQELAAIVAYINTQMACQNRNCLK